MAGRRRRFIRCRRERFGAVDVVLETFDDIFAEVIAALDFDEDQQPAIAPAVGDAAFRAQGFKDSAAGLDAELAFVERYGRRPAHHGLQCPSRREWCLIAKALRGQHLDALDLVAVALFEYGASAPGSASRRASWSFHS